MTQKAIVHESTDRGGLQTTKINPENPTNRPSSKDNTRMMNKALLFTDLAVDVFAIPMIALISLFALWLRDFTHTIMFATIAIAMSTHRLRKMVRNGSGDNNTNV